MMPTNDSTTRESWLLLSRFLRRPKLIGSVAPSSRFLAEAMMRPIDWPSAKAIAELGPGTGVFTRHIRRLAARDATVLLFEQDALLRDRLAEAYPGYRCYPDAADLREAVQADNVGGLDAVVSGLPFFNFAPPLRSHLLEQIVLSLKPGGVFVAFQYSLQMKRPLERLFEVEAIRFVPLNVPPAFVYVCRPRSERP